MTTLNRILMDEAEELNETFPRVIATETEMLLINVNLK